MITKPHKITQLDAHDLGMLRLLFLNLVRGDWYTIGVEILKSEQRIGRAYDTGRLMKGLKALGITQGITRVQLQRMVDTAKRVEALGLRPARIQGIPRFYAARICDWMDEGEVSRREAEILFYYRQLHFHGRHELGWKIFKVETLDDLNALKQLAYQCEPYMLLV
jgi:hypothetical protein